jgi:predicted ATP-grasp superfamily ATP-dependent carboligase
VVRSLGRRGLEVHAAPFMADAPALASRYIRKAHLLPRYEGDGEAWRAAVAALLKAWDFDLVMPCCDRGVLMFDAHRQAFGDVRVAMPSARAIEFLFDKHATRQVAQDLGIPVAKGRLLRADDTAADLVCQFGLPLFLKPRRSYELSHLHDRRNVERFGSVAALADGLRRIDDPSRWLVERSFSGAGIGVSIIASGGRILTAFQHRRLREPVGGGGSSKRISEAVQPDLLAAAGKICQATSLTGVAMLEFRMNGRGAWILVEVNARFWGSLPLPLALGVDFPWYLYQLFRHGEEVGRVDYRAGVYARNLLINVYDFLFRNPDGVSLKQSAVLLGQAASLPWRWLRGSEAVDEFVLDDPRPGLQEIAYATRLLSRGFGKAAGRGAT